MILHSQPFGCHCIHYRTLSTDSVWMFGECREGPFRSEFTETGCLSNPGCHGCDACNAEDMQDLAGHLSLCVGPDTEPPGHLHETSHFLTMLYANECFSYCCSGALHECVLLALHCCFTIFIKDIRLFILSFRPLQPPFTVVSGIKALIVLESEDLIVPTYSVRSLIFAEQSRRRTEEETQRTPATGDNTTMGLGSWDVALLGFGVHYPLYRIT